MAMNLDCPPTMQDGKKKSPHYGHQRADITNSSSHHMANITHKPPNRASTNTTDRKGQHNLVSRPERTEKTEETQAQECHKEILSVHIDDTQKSTYNAKVGNTGNTIV